MSRRSQVLQSQSRRFLTSVICTDLPLLKKKEEDWWALRIFKILRIYTNLSRLRRLPTFLVHSTITSVSFYYCIFRIPTGVLLAVRQHPDAVGVAPSSPTVAHQHHLYSSRRPQHVSGKLQFIWWSLLIYLRVHFYWETGIVCSVKIQIDVHKDQST